MLNGDIRQGVTQFVTQICVTNCVTPFEKQCNSGKIGHFEKSSKKPEKP